MGFIDSIDGAGAGAGRVGSARGVSTAAFDAAGACGAGWVVVDAAPEFAAGEGALAPAGLFTTIGRSRGTSPTGCRDGAAGCVAGCVGRTGSAAGALCTGACPCGAVEAGDVDAGAGAGFAGTALAPSPGMTCPGRGFCACFFTSITGSFTGGLFVPGADPVAGCAGVPGSAAGSAFGSFLGSFLGSSTTKPDRVFDVEVDAAAFAATLNPTPAQITSDHADAVFPVRIHTPM